MDELGVEAGRPPHSRGAEAPPPAARPRSGAPLGPRHRLMMRIMSSFCRLGGVEESQAQRRLGVPELLSVTVLAAPPLASPARGRPNLEGEIRKWSFHFGSMDLNVT